MATTETLAVDIPLLPFRTLQSGNISLMYEAGRIRYIKYKNDEVLRMIYPALRDETWKTIPGTLENETVNTTEHGFAITYTSRYDSGVVKYTADFEINGNGDTIEFVMKGKALTGFKSKRVGLCVHHPIAPCAGKALKVTHPNGKEGEYIFPVLISPTWPFTDIEDMRWSSGSADMHLRFEGDLFETEDQRNWTDDSYKTYSGPQYKTKMLDIKEGDTIEHRITLQVKENKLPFPKIGYQRNKEQQLLTVNADQLFRSLPVNHLRVELHMAENNWKNILHDALAEATSIGTRLELAVFFKPSADIQELIKELEFVGTYLDSLLILSDEHPLAPEELYKRIYQEIKARFPGLQIGYGTNSWFAELNQNVPESIKYDFLNFLISPQVHQTDGRSILENLGSQHTTIETLRQSVGDVPVHVSIYFNNRADDDRLFTSFAAWWAINAIHNFASAGHLTLFELIGSKGVIKNEHELSPVYNLLKTIKAFDPEWIYKGKNNEVIIENANGETKTFVYA